MQSPMFLVGKLAGLQEDAFTLPASSTGASLVYLQDKFSSRRFLVDSSASVSVFPVPVSSSISGVILLWWMDLPHLAQAPELFLYI